MIVYFPYVCAEFCGISGIVTLLFTAMFANRYVTPNLSDATKEDAER
jgi:NhaP-type Na+/H+ or K+/H+ antiporter